MNINQIMKIWDYDVSKMENFDLLKNGLDALKYLFALDYKYAECMEFGSTKTHSTNYGSNVVVIFNKLTSEVLYIDFKLIQDNTYYIYTPLTDPSKFEIFNAYGKDDIKCYLSENVMLDQLNELVDKEPDEIVNFQIDDNALKTIDAASAVLNITRQDFITKVLLEQIPNN